MCNVLLSGELKFLQDRYGFFKPRYPRYATDLSHPAIRYAIAAAITVSGRYAATFPNNGPCLVQNNCGSSFSFVKTP